MRKPLQNTKASPFLLTQSVPFETAFKQSIAISLMISFTTSFMYYFCFSDFTKQGKGSLPCDAWIIEISCSIVYPFGNVLLQLHMQGKSGSTVPSLVTYFRCGFVQELKKKIKKNKRNKHKACKTIISSTKNSFTQGTS